MSAVTQTFEPALAGQRVPDGLRNHGPMVRSNGILVLRHLAANGRAGGNNALAQLSEAIGLREPRRTLDVLLALHSAGYVVLSQRGIGVIVDDLYVTEAGAAYLAMTSAEHLEATPVRLRLVRPPSDDFDDELELDEVSREQSPSAPDRTSRRAAARVRRPHERISASQLHQRRQAILQLVAAGLLLGDDASATAIGQRLGLPYATAHNDLSKLSREGLVERVTKGHRSVSLTITPAGEACLDRPVAATRVAPLDQTAIKPADQTAALAIATELARAGEVERRSVAQLVADRRDQSQGRTRDDLPPAERRKYDNYVKASKHGKPHMRKFWARKAQEILEQPGEATA